MTRTSGGSGVSFIEEILDYIAGAPLYEVIENNGKEYRLVHAGLTNFAPDKDMDEYDLYDFLEERADYSKRYYPDKNIFLVTGHTPTVLINEWGKVAVFCVETEEVIYVDGRKERNYAIKPGEVVLLAGRPDSGMTALAAEMAEYLVSEEKQEIVRELRKLAIESGSIILVTASLSKYPYSHPMIRDLRVYGLEIDKVDQAVLIWNENGEKGISIVNSESGETVSYRWTDTWRSVKM